MLTQEAEMVDLSELDMLDDIRHCVCNACYPGDLSFGQRFVAICGREALASGRTDMFDPPNACADCKRLRYGYECPRCGA